MRKVVDVLTKLVISRLNFIRDLILAGRKLRSGRLNSSVEAVGQSRGAIEEVSHAVGQPLLQSVVLFAQLGGDPLAHGGTLDIFSMVTVILDRTVRDEFLLGQMMHELIVRDREGTRHRCALTT